MKEAIIKSIAAIICVAIVCLAFSSSAGTYSNAELKAAEIISESISKPQENIINNSHTGSVDSGITVPDTETPQIHIPDSDITDEDEADTTVTIQKSDNPADWSTPEIVDYYKMAAQKSHAGTKSQHKIKIEKIKVNGKEFDGITNLMDKLLANNSEDKDGITGGYESLMAEDVKSARAYKTGNNTVIEMDMKDQVSGPAESDKSGSVGHAITVVGDISAVTKQITDLGFPLDINEKETKIYYTNATVKVVINENGKIVNGTWEYTVEISLQNYTVLKNTHVDSTSILMKNTLTVNNGFKK